jgi:hypothetical protein
VPLRGREVHEPVSHQPLLVVAGADRHLAGEDDDQRVLVNLMLGQALPGGQGQQDDPVGLIVGAQDAWSVGLNDLGVQVPEVHDASIIRPAPAPDTCTAPAYARL